MIFNKIDALTNDEFISVINNSSCYTDVLKKCGYDAYGSSQYNMIIKERMLKLGLSFKKENENYYNNKNNKSIPLNNILVKNSNYSRTHLKERLIKSGIKEYKCECCGISEWQGKTIALELHHINGINNDNRLENLQILCPNCHSQTITFSGRKGKGRQRLLEATNLEPEIKKEIIDTVKALGIVNARKKLPYRNSLINRVIKLNSEKIVMIDLNNNELTFPSVMAAAEYMFNELHLGKNVETLRVGISKCCNNKQVSVANGYKFYKRSNKE